MVILRQLNRKNILYIPDFLINAGGIISVYHEQINEINSKKVMEMTELIYDKVNDVIKHSEKNSLSTNSSAIQLAKRNPLRNITNSEELTPKGQTPAARTIEAQRRRRASKRRGENAQPVSGRRGPRH